MLYNFFLLQNITLDVVYFSSKMHSQSRLGRGVEFWLYLFQTNFLSYGNSLSFAKCQHNILWNKRGDKWLVHDPYEIIERLSLVSILFAWTSPRVVGQGNKYSTEPKGNENINKNLLVSHALISSFYKTVYSNYTHLLIFVPNPHSNAALWNVETWSANLRTSSANVDCEPANVDCERATVANVVYDHQRILIFIPNSHSTAVLCVSFPLKINHIVLIFAKVKIDPIRMSSLVTNSKIINILG